MRAIIQRVSQAQVAIENKVVGSIETGLLVLLGIEHSDTETDVEWVCRKIVSLRIFADDAGQMNKSVADIDGNILLVSQFTLHASTVKGNRPSFIKSAHPTLAEPLYTKAIAQLELLLQKPVATGVFGANMQVQLINDGPVTIIIDSKNRE